MGISVNITAPSARILEPTEADGYMSVARELLPAVKVLLSGQPRNIPTRAAVILAGQALECILKAFLWHKRNKGNDRAYRLQIEHKQQHDLIALWGMAHNEGLSPELNAPPDWCRILSKGHGPIFSYRYQVGKNKAAVHMGAETPPLDHMACELEKLFEIAQSSRLNHP